MALWSARLAGLSDSDRRQRLAEPHPLYTQHIDAWDTLLNAYEGTGGFSDGSYLWPYPAEEATDHARRRRQARYHNFARPIVDLYVRYLFARGVSRSTTNADLQAWWDNADGQGTGLTDVMRRALRQALTVGHTGILVDRDALPPVGPTRAEDEAAIRCVLYPAASILDWREQLNELSGVKLLEALPDPGLLEERDLDHQRYLLWDREAWARVTEQGEIVTGDDGRPQEGELDLGLVPLVLVRPLRSPVTPSIGRSVLGDSQVYRALYNRCSEEDEVLRSQAFSVFTVEVPEAARVEDVKNQLGASIGAARAIVVQGTASYITPDMQVPGAIRDNTSFLVREIYRVAHLPYQLDSREAESGEAIRLKYQELNEVLTELAAEAERVERALVHVWHRWQYPTVEAADQAEAAAETSIQYPREFFITDFAAELERWAQALALRLGSTYEQHARKHIVRLMSPDLPAELLDTIDAEIDAQPTDADERETEREARAEAMANAVRE